MFTRRHAGCSFFSSKILHTYPKSGMKRRRIHLHHHPHTGRKGRGALLFVHGAYTDSTYWGVNFVPFFQHHGFDCFAVDLSGHGGSEGRERLDEFGLDDYADDIAHAVSLIDQPITIVGHSMGALAVQRYLDKSPAAATIFLAPVPTTGLSASATRLAIHYPSFFQALYETSKGLFSEANNDLLAKIYFGPDTTGKDVLNFLPSVAPESRRAVMDMTLLPLRAPVSRRKIPALVIGGEADNVFPSSNLFFSALPWKAKVVRVPGAGHMLPLDQKWQTVATHMLEWMCENAPT